MKRTISAALVSVLGLLAAVSLRGEILEQVLVKVNGEIITKTDLEQRQVAYLRQQRNQPLTEELLRNDAELKKTLADITPQLLVESIDELLLIQRGKELGYTMTDDQFSKIVENIRKENKLESDEQFQAALKQEGMALADLRKSLERQMLINRVQQSEVYQRIAIAEDEARAYYDAHRDEFTSPAELTLREILITVNQPSKAPVNSVSVGLDEEAQKRAGEIRARVARGDDFGKVAAEVSDAPSKANGGLIGPVKRSDLAEEFQKILTPLKPGDITPVIRTARGYHVLKLETATDTRTLPFEQAREQIADKVFAGKRQGEFEKYLKKLRAQAIIEWKNAELKKAYEQRVGAPAPVPTPVA